MEKLEIKEIMEIREIRNKSAKVLLDNDDLIYTFYEDMLLKTLIYYAEMKKVTFEKDSWYFLDNLKNSIKYLKGEIRNLRAKRGDFPPYGYSRTFYNKLEDYVKLFVY